MPKQNENESVLHDWVHKLPFQMQALLLTATRGPDTMTKHNPGKAIVRYLRGCIAKPAGEWNGTNNNDFMWGAYEHFDAWAKDFWDDHDSYPHHFIMHLVHCAEVIGHFHPDAIVAGIWGQFYLDACDSFHMQPESKLKLEKRLNDFGAGVHNFKSKVI